MQSLTQTTTVSHPLRIDCCRFSGWDDCGRVSCVNINTTSYSDMRHHTILDISHQKTITLNIDTEFVCCISNSTRPVLSSMYYVLLFKFITRTHKNMRICDHPPRNQCKVTPGSFSVYVISRKYMS